jgi:hypothetical protein
MLTSDRSINAMIIGKIFFTFEENGSLKQTGKDSTSIFVLLLQFFPLVLF